jgi:cytochrome c oxidase subunit 2
MFSNIPLLPEEASTVAPQVDALYFFLVAVSAFFALLIAIVVIVFAVKYRRRSATDRPQEIHGSLGLELAWTIIPFGIAMVMFFWGARVYVTLQRPPDDALSMFAVGKQWMWKIQHLEGRREINELHIPIGRPIKITLTSEDVIHSFFIPAFRVKQDVFPDRYTTVWFQATKPGSYHLFCAEYCGTDHSRMGGTVYAMDPRDYEQWLAGAAGAPAPAAAAAPSGPSLAEAGAAAFQQLGCASCHRAGPGALGPNLAGVPGSQVKLVTGETVVADDAYLRESILNPQAKVVEGFQPVMPVFKGLVSEEQIMQLIAYIKSLTPGGGSAGAAAPAAQN